MGFPSRRRAIFGHPAAFSQALLFFLKGAAPFGTEKAAARPGKKKQRSTRGGFGWFLEGPWGLFKVSWGWSGGFGGGFGGLGQAFGCVGVVLGTFWGALGGSWGGFGCLGMVLGTSWGGFGCLAMSFGRRGLILRSS